MPQLPKLFRALADPNRLRIINILLQGDVCVCDLQSILALPQPFISRHLAYLRRHGMVRDRREGRRVYYSLALEGPLHRAVRLLLGEPRIATPALQADLKRLEELARAGRLKSLPPETAWEDFSSRAA